MQCDLAACLLDVSAKFKDVTGCIKNIFIYLLKKHCDNENFFVISQCFFDFRIVLYVRM